MREASWHDKMELSVATPAVRMKQTDSDTELALVERCKRRDAEAFGKIVDAYQNRVYGFVKRMVRDPEDAADVAQEVFIRAFQAFGRFDGRSSLRTWLFRIAHNLCIDRARRNDRSPIEASLDARDDEDGAWEISDARWAPEQLVLNAELYEQVEKALAAMSEKLRTVLLLHDREDFAYDEIAETLNLPIGTVKSRLFLARAHLQKHLSVYLDGNRA
jgi:RNA polymerase sigma-70 factor (ECF subfamily)